MGRSKMIVTKNSLNKDLPKIRKVSLVGHGKSSRVQVSTLTGRRLRRAIAKELKQK